MSKVADDIDYAETEAEVEEAVEETNEVESNIEVLRDKTYEWGDDCEIELKLISNDGDIEAVVSIDSASLEKIQVLGSLIALGLQDSSYTILGNHTESEAMVTIYNNDGTTVVYGCEENGETKYGFPSWFDYKSNPNAEEMLTEGALFIEEISEDFYE